MADNSFGKNLRLLSADDFLYLRKSPSIFTTKFLRIYYKKSLEDKNSRIGIAVTKKVGKANKRNLCKRVIREFFRKSEYKYVNLDYMILVSPKLFKLNNNPKAILKKELDFCFNKILKQI